MTQAAPKTSTATPGESSATDEPERWVVGAVIVHDGELLLLQRAADDFMGGLWELPSGVRESGESNRDALAREIEEETGLLIAEVVSELRSFDYQSKSGALTRQLNFLVRPTSHEPVILSEHTDYRWIPLADSARELPSVSEETLEVIASAERTVS